MAKITKNDSKSSKVAPELKRGRGRPAGGGGNGDGKRKVKPEFKKEENFQSYIYKVLKHVNADIGIQKRAMSTMNSIVLEIYRKISREAAIMSRNTEKTLGQNTMQCAIKLTIPGELCKHSVTEGAKAYAKYMKSRGAALKN